MQRGPHSSLGTATAIVVLALLCAPAPAAAPLPRDIHVTDVTPVSFVVVWTVDEASTGTVEVFSDVLAGSAVSGAVIEPALVLGGDPAVGIAAEDLGVLRVRVRGLDPGTPYFFRTITTPKAAGPPETVPASGALYSTVTSSRSVAASANGLAAEVLDSNGTTSLPGALVNTDAG